MIEYAVVSGKNFLILLDPALIPLQKLYAKLGLNLSGGEAGGVTLILIVVMIVSFFFLHTR